MGHLRSSVCDYGTSINKSVRGMCGTLRAVTDIVSVDPVQPEKRAIARAAACLRRGGLVAFPTETVYGLGANALDRRAVRRIFEAKGRPANDPLIVHVTGASDLASLTVSLPGAAGRLAARFWPGPLTLVLQRDPRVPDEVTAGLSTVAVRVPAHPVARALLAAAQVPVAAPSANLFSRPSPTRASHVLDDLGGRIDMILDAGPTTLGVESTVLDLTAEPPAILRPGAVTIEQLREMIPDVGLRTAGEPAGDVLPSPGLLSEHYAPRTPMTLYQGEPVAAGAALRRDARTALDAGRRVGVLATAEQGALLDGLPVVIGDLGAESDIAAIAARLYAALRELDAAHLDLILAVDLSHDEGLRRAIRDRLRRAARQVIQAR